MNFSRVINIVVQGKGGVGKTFVASLLCQLLGDLGRRFHGYDLDPINHSLVGIGGLKDVVSEVDILDGGGGKGVGGDVHQRKFDDFLVGLVEGDVEDMVIDTGATMFVSFNNYLLGFNMFDVLGERGIKVVIHCVVCGGGEALECVQSLDSVCVSYAGMKNVEVVVWLNEYMRGPVLSESDGKDVHFFDFKVYERHKDSIGEVVLIPYTQNSLLRGDLEDFSRRRITFREVDTLDGFNFITKSRLNSYYKDLSKLGKKALRFGNGNGKSVKGKS